MQSFSLNVANQNKDSFISIFLKRRLYYTIAVGFFAFLFVPNEALDSYRYYEDAHAYDNLDPFGMIEKSVDENLDFIYYLFFYILIQLDLPIQLVTAISVAVYLYMSLTIMDTYLKLNSISTNKISYYFAVISSYFSVSYIIIFSISRNLTAIMFFLMALNHFIQGKKLRSLVFVLLSVFTHFGMMLFSILFGLGFLVQKYGNNDRPRSRLLIIGTIVGLLSNYWISFIMDLIAYLPFFGKYEIYLKYLNNNLSNAFTAGFGIWDKLMFFTTFLMMMFCLLHIKKFNLLLNMSLVLYLWLVTAMGFSFMFTQRTLMLTLPFIGILVIEHFKQRKPKSSNLMFLLLFGISVTAFVINVYSYRDLWVFELP